MNTDPQKPEIKNLLVVRKATNAEIESYIEQVGNWLGEGKKFSQITALARKRFGKEWRQTAEYIARARRQQLERANKTKTDVFAEAVDFYETVISNPKVRMADKLVARERIDKLFGIYPPKIVRTQMEGVEGGAPIETKDITPAWPLKDIPKDKLLAIYERLEREIAAETATTKPA